MIDKNFMGMNGFVWWMGVVEDRKDPLKLGRCRVRIFGWHSENKAELPTIALPWSQAMLPLNNTNAYSPKESDTVVGFFMDGEDAQHPVMMGVLPSIPMEKGNPNIAFNDPRDDAQLLAAPIKRGDSRINYPRKTDEPTTTRLARGDSEFVPEQIDQLTEDQTVYEQSPAYNASYPYNKVIESESGHALELDDTPNFERVHLYHKNGSNLEMRPDGSVQQKVMKNHTRNILGDDVNYIKGNSIFFIDGDLTYVIGGKLSIVAQKEISVLSETKSINLTAKTNFGAAAEISASVSGKLSSALGGLSAYTSVGGLKTDVNALGVLTCSGTASATYGAGGLCTISGATINLQNLPTSGSTSKSTTSPTEFKGVQASGADSLKSAQDAAAGINTPIPPAESTWSTAGAASTGSFDAVNGLNSGVTTLEKVNGTTYTNWDAVASNPTLTERVTSIANESVNKIKDTITGLPSDVAKEVNYTGVVNAGDKLAEASIVAAQYPSVQTLKDLAQKSSALVGEVGKTLNGIQNLNALELSTRNFTKNLCTLQDAKNVYKATVQEVRDKISDFKKAILSDRDALREKIQNISNEYKNKLKELDEKALDEWISSHRSDTSCAICVQEAESGLSAGQTTDQVRQALVECLHREADAYINQYKTNVPITDASIIKSQKEICGTTTTKIDLGG